MDAFVLGIFTGLFRLDGIFRLHDVDILLR